LLESILHYQSLIKLTNDTLNYGFDMFTKDKSIKLVGKIII